MSLSSFRRWAHANLSKSRRRLIPATPIFRAEALEKRVLLSADAWTNVAGGDWDTAANWSAGVPIASSDVTINLIGTETITHATSGNDSVNSIISNEPINLSAGTFNVASNITLTGNSLTLAGAHLAAARLPAPAAPSWC